MDSDDVIDYMIMEALSVKQAKEERDAEKERKRKEWQNDGDGLARLRAAAS
jgi:hypothetical protein